MNMPEFDAQKVISFGDNDWIVRGGDGKPA